MDGIVETAGVFGLGSMVLFVAAASAAIFCAAELKAKTFCHASLLREARKPRKKAFYWINYKSVATFT